MLMTPVYKPIPPLEANKILTNDGTVMSWTDTPILVSAIFSDPVTGVAPILGAHFATKEYIDLAIGSSFDLFFSDTDDGVVANTHVMYAMETGEAQSTEDSPSLSAGDNQLALSWLSEAGIPGTSTLREGVYDCHIHLNKNVGGAVTTVYWKLSYVDADGSSGKTLICTSETSGEIITSELDYDIHAVVAAEIPLGATKRILFEIYANISSGSNVTLTATLEGTNDSHMSFQVPSSVWQMQGDELDKINAGTAPTFAGLIIADDGYIGSVSDTDAMQISSSGIVTFSQAMWALTLTLTSNPSTIFSSNPIVIKPSGDASDYFEFTTVANVPTIGTVGTGDGCDLKITASSGVIDFDDENLTTTGTLDCGAATLGGNLIIPDAGYIGSVSDTDAIQIEAGGDVVISQDLTVEGTGLFVGNVGIGVIPSATEHLYIGGTGASMKQGRYTNTATQGAGIVIERARGTITNPLVVADNDKICAFNFRGYSANAGVFKTCAAIEVFIDGTPDSGGDSTDMPGKIRLRTTPEGASIPITRIEIKADGTVIITTVDINSGAIDDVTIGTNSPCTELQVDTININSNQITGSGDLFIDSDAGSSLYIGAGASSVQSASIRNNTTAEAANMYIAPTGYAIMFRSNSSARYKTIDSDMTTVKATSILNLTPVKFHSLHKADDPDKVFYGLTAEDVAANFPEAARYDSDGLPDSYDINFIVAALIKNQKELTKRMKTV